MKYFKIIFLFTIFLLLDNCQSFQDAMTGANKKTTDEFLVKTKDPLILPPQYEKLPLPNSKSRNEEKSLQSALGSSNKSNENSKISSDLENMVLKELGKNN